METINEGNTAETYKCWHEIFQRPVVQKTVSLLGLADALALSEPGLLNKINHDHLVKVWEAQWTPGRAPNLKCITFTMPFYAEGSLHSVLERCGELPLGQAFKIAAQLLKALHYLHVEQRILHRDIKPGNVFLDEGFRVAYLGDLGNAARMDELNEADANGGTRLYRPPELAGERYGIAGDIYSMGFTLLELFGGPLDYADLDNIEITRRLDRGLRAVADRYFRLGPTIPTSLERLVLAMVSRSVARRPSSAAAALRALGRISFIDWLPADSLGRREGFWPPTAPKVVLAVEERTIRSGPDAGLVELTVLHRKVQAQEWRRISQLSDRVRPDDRRARRAVYDAIVAFCANRWAVR
ncbi:serine/threonine-protein kinase [Mycolicibacterium sp. CH28]|nr:serine/threonine-protein kinase [Mycolicibacterium sp. CH28]